MRKKSFQVLSLILALVILYQGFCWAKMGYLDLNAIFFYGGVVALSSVIIVVSLRLKRKSIAIWTLCLLLLFSPIKVYYNYFSNIQCLNARHKGDVIVDKLTSFKSKYGYFPGSLGAAGVADTCYFVGFWKYPFRYQRDSLAKFSLFFAVNWQEQYQYSQAYGGWSWVD